MPKTAKQHFDEDINRAKSLANHAKTMPNATEGEILLRDDVLRGAWMFSIGAMDAYFCDAYTDIFTLLLRAKSLQPKIQLSKKIQNISLPIGSILNSYKSRPNWGWRMASRKMMEKSNILSVDYVGELFKPFFRTNYKLFDDAIVDTWINSSNSTKRVYGITSTDYAILSGRFKNEERTKALKHLKERFKILIQRRHDCIHNCDRPKTKPQKIDSADEVIEVITDVKFFVDQFEKHINAEFKSYLQSLGCNPVTTNKLGLK